MTWSKRYFNNTDLVISVQLINDRSSLWAARATFCTLDWHYYDSYRPLSGMMGLNMNSILLPNGSVS